ncbi:MAG: hypothetical protein Q8N51_05455 [Gammaproteobacteria bacterium]|nr:hypothetical protein [Gammaproteobacteria bacterium]
MARKSPIVTELSGLSNSSGDLTLKTRPGEPGQLLCIELVAARNTTTDATLVHVGVERAGLQLWLETLVLTTHGRTYNYYHPLWIPSDYSVGVKFASAGSGTVCSAVVMGYLSDRPAAE